MPELGTFAVLLALAAATWSVGASFVGHRWRRPALVRSAEAGLRASFVSLTVASAVLVVLFLTRDFSVRYVAEYSDSFLPTAYTVAAFWAGQAGSLLLWAWLLAGAGSLVGWCFRDRHRDLMPIVTLVLALVLVVFVALTAFTSNPFARLPFVPQEGAGLNPMLHNWGMLYHPPATFLGYVGFTVPFAFAVAALVTGNLDGPWLRVARVWMLLSWALLWVGIVLGARWAYTELGWGGYWAWDPVENVSLLPWLTATAFLHTAAVQERRGSLRVANLALVTATFALTLFGTFLVRSGVASSVHAFAESPAAMYLLVAIGAAVIVPTVLITWRLPRLRGPGAPLAPWSREMLLALAGGLLVAYGLAILWGTLFPVVTSVVQGREATVGAPFFDRVTLPVAVALLVLLGLGPAVAWRRATARGVRRRLDVPVAVGLLAGAIAAVVDGGRSPATIVVLSLSAFALAAIAGEFHRGVHAHPHRRLRDHLGAVGRLFARTPRRYGGAVAHLGVVLLIVGIALDVTYRSDERVSLSVDEEVTVGSYDLTFAALEPEVGPTRMAITATLDVAAAGGRSLGSLTTERYLGVNQDQPRTQVGVRSLVRGDVYVILGDVDVEAGTAGFQVLLHPGMLWLWLGGALILLGGVFALRPVDVPSRRTAEHDAPPEDDRVVVGAGEGEVR